MTLKLVLWATAIWTLLAIGGAVLGAWYIGTHPIPGTRTEKRMEMLGQGAGVVTVIGYAVIWLPYCAKIGKQRREAREKAAKQTKKSRKGKAEE